MVWNVRWFNFLKKKKINNEKKQGARKKFIGNSGYYQKLLEVHSEHNSVALKQINLDLSRTFPNHEFFQEDKVGFNSLRRILIAYSWRNPLVSYCQSLNYIVGLLILHFSEEEAFWVLVVLLEDILPANFYSPDLKGVRTDDKVLSMFSKKNFFSYLFLQVWCMKGYQK